MAYFYNKNNNKLLVFIFLLSLPVFAQEIIFTDGFENHRPFIISTAVTTGTVGDNYSYDVDATDVDGDTLTYLLASAPNNMDINSLSGVISWTPGASGSFPVTVEVSDGRGDAGMQSWSIEVALGQDSDSDGLADYQEGLLGTDPNDPDSDDDGLKDGDEVNTYKTDPLDPDSDADSLTDGDEVNTYSTDPVENDTDGDFFGDGLELAAGTDPLNPADFPIGPPDPEAIATSFDPTVSTPVFDASAFIYEHAPPIQTGMPEGTIDPVRVVVLRGMVMTRDGTPLPGVDITVHEHSEYGQTQSRVDGQFDMVVNGGGYITINFEKNGFLSVQRRVDAPWQNYLVMPEVAMVPLDTQVTTIDLNTGTTLMAQGSTSDDVDGQRHAAVVFPAGTTAELLLEGGGTQPISGLNIRATEYTVGDNGAAAMPGVLPMASGYTYAVELSADEAMTSGVSGLNFNQPVFNYVDNFLGFPVGSTVPSGFYDMERAQWVPEENGLVIKIISITGGLVDVDVDGDDSADTGSALSDIGFTDAERQSLAASYIAGQSLWRVPMTHFTPVDHNWPYGPPPDATPPRQRTPRKETEIEQEICEDPRLAEYQNQVVRQEVPVTGTSFTLNYRSTDVPDWDTGQSLEIPLSEDSAANIPANSGFESTKNEKNGQTSHGLKAEVIQNAVPDSLKRIDLQLSVAGQTHSRSFPPTPGQSTTFTWDGKDAYQREVSGRQAVTGTIGYVYEAVYYSPAESEIAFNKFGREAFKGVTARQDVVLGQPFRAVLGNFDARSQGLGGWMLNVHKAYDPVGQVLVSGGGSSRGATQNQQGIISRIAGRVDPADGFFGDGGPATNAMMDRPLDVFVMPDGGFLITDHDNHRIRRISPEGIISTIAGNGSSVHSGDGGPAAVAGTPDPLSVAMGQDGSIYFTESWTRIRKITPDGLISTIAGTGVRGHSGDGGLATLADIAPDKGLILAPDGTLYFGDAPIFSDLAGGRVRKIDTNGIIDTIAGSASFEYGGDGGPARAATMRDPDDLALGPDGHIFIALRTRVRAITPDGLMLTIAGNGTEGNSGDGGLAWQAQLGHATGLAVGKDGLYIADEDFDVVRKVDSEGIITTVAGSIESDEAFGDGGPALAAGFDLMAGIDIDALERIYIADDGENQIRRVEPLMPGFSTGDIGIASLDGSEYYQFNSAGKHLRTYNGLTGAAIYEFDYDSEGILETITDGDGNVTTIQRDLTGSPTGILSPFGQLTAISVDSNGFVNKITNPEGEQLRIESSVGGLITKTTDPRGKINTFTYGESGRLLSQSDNNGFSQSLTRTQVSSDFSVARTTGLSHTVTYDVEFDASNTQTSTNTAPDGSQYTSQYNASAGTHSSTSPTGMTSSIQQGGDPRFGMQAPIIQSLEVSASGGPTLIASNSSSATLAEPADPLSLVTISGTSTTDGRMTLSTYTSANRTQVITSPAGRSTTVEIDEQGHLVSYQYADLAPVTAHYNQLGQLVSLVSGTGGDARTSSFTYGTDGFRESITDPLNRTSSLTRDAAGRITAKTMPGDTTALFSYDTAGDLNGVTPPGRPQHGFTYTRYGQIESVTPPVVTGGGPSYFTYNDDRQVTSISRPGQELLGYNYDDHGRIQTITLSEAGLNTATYTFDYVVGTQLDSITGPGVQTVNYSYQGDLITGVTWGGVVEGNFARNFDNAFRVSNEAINAGVPVVFKYDDDDLITGAGALEISRSAENGLAQNSVLGVVNDSWVYNDFGEVENYAVTADLTPIYTVDYTLDKLGRITQEVETIEGQTDTYNYEYGPRGQLVEVKRNAVTVESYTYDENGNRLTASVGGVDVSATYDDQDRLLTHGTTSYEYTPAGRLLIRTRPGDQVTTFDYDIVGNLRGVTLPDTTEVIYGLDGPDRRVQRSVNDTITHLFLFNGLMPVAQLDEFGNVVTQFVYAGSTVPDLMIREGVNYRLVTDQIGSVRLVVNADTGAITQRIDYDSFGNITTDTNPGFQPFGFAGGIYDPDTGLVRFGYRDYDAETGRWTAQDPVGFNGNDANLYRYVNNNPINLKDAAGLSGWDTARGFLDGLNQGIQETLNPGLAIQHGVESLVDYLFGDWMEENGYFRHPHPGKLQAPPPGVDPGDYADGEFYGSCTVAVASLAVGGGGAAGPAIAGKIGSLVGKLKQLPGLAKRLSEGAKGLLKRSKPRELSKAADEIGDAADDFLKKLYREGFEQPVGKADLNALPNTPNNRQF